MATKTTATTPTTKYFPLGGLDPQDLLAAAEVFNDPNAWRPIKFTSIFAINNDRNNPGIFLKKKSFPAIGWNYLPCNARETELLFGDSKEKDPGLLFDQSINLVVVDQSPRLVETTENGAAAYKDAVDAKEAGSAYDPLLLELSPRKGGITHIYCSEAGDYEDENGNSFGGADFHKAIQDKYKKENYVRLRTWYLVFLLDDQGQFLHKLPVVLSVAGLVSVEFGEAFHQFKSGILDQLSSLPGMAKLNAVQATKHAMRSYSCLLELEGGEAGLKRNFITKVKKTEDGYYRIKPGYIKDEQMKKIIEECALANDGFSYRFAKQAEADWGVHALSGEVEKNLLPASVHDVTVAEPDILF